MRIIELTSDVAEMQTIKTDIYSTKNTYTILFKSDAVCIVIAKSVWGNNNLPYQLVKEPHESIIDYNNFIKSFLNDIEECGDPVTGAHLAWNKDIVTRLKNKKGAYSNET